MAGFRTMLRSAALVAVAAFAVATPEMAAAEEFIAGKSTGMTRCVRAILDGYKVKKVNVHGHHFHCFPLGRGPVNNGRSFVLVHDQFGPDDSILFRFRVDSGNRFVPRSMRVKKNTSLLMDIAKMLNGVEFRGPDGPPLDYQGYRDAALDIRPQRVKDWETAAYQIHLVVVAELANRRTDNFAPLEVRCNRPIFFEHDNYRGEAIRLTGNRRDLDRVVVNGKKMGNRISSMCLPAGWRATVHLGRNFQGGNFTFTGPVEISDLKRQNVPGTRRRPLNWGDAISSIEITRSDVRSKKIIGVILGNGS